MINFSRRVASVTLFNLRTMAHRKGSVAAAMVGIAGVVAVLVGVLSIAEGIRAAVSVAGGEDVAVVLRSGADNEMTSGLSREEVRTIADAAGVARDAEGAMVSGELFVMINLPKRTSGTDANVPLRGVEQAAIAVRGDIEFLEGRAFATGRNEVMVGAGAARSFAGLDLNAKIKVGADEWTVVGIFTGGGPAESEIWTDAAVLQAAFNRGDSFQSVYAKLESAAAFDSFEAAVTSNPQLKVNVRRQSEFLEEQTIAVRMLVNTIGVFIASMMALGALFGALNTMYSAVTDRTREIATLRALGFGSLTVILSVLFESIVVALAGGAAGAAIAYIGFDGIQTSTMNFQTFSQVAFAFAVTPRLLIVAVIMATTIGFFGGLFPAIRAARLPIAAALREV